MEEAVSASPPFSACLGWRQQQRRVARLKLGRVVVAAAAIALALAVVYPSVVARAFETTASLGRPVLCPYTTNFASRKASAELPVKNKTKTGKAEDVRQLKEDLERFDDKRASDEGELTLYELPPESTERGPASVEWPQSHLLRIRYYGYHKEQMNAATDALLNACRQIPSVIVKGPAMLPTQRKMCCRYQRVHSLCCRAFSRLLFPMRFCLLPHPLLLFLLSSSSPSSFPSSAFFPSPVPPSRLFPPLVPSPPPRPPI
eukprot:GHVU01173561.1.p1 GENE.GHVU01173561.1~~GHVU01173561.1.p1  ORF type:complete len:259 (+),score=49.44 GHVU01173561.1:168-944(+)